MSFDNDLIHLGKNRGAPYREEPVPDPMYWSLMRDRAASFFSSNPIVRHIDGKDYRVGVAMRPDEYGRIVVSHPRPPEDIDFIHGLIVAFNNATEEQKIFFLQNKQNKIFEITNSFLCFFERDSDADILLELLRNLLNMVSVDPITESTFYHSELFINRLYTFFKNSVTIMTREFFLAAIQKYPDLTQSRHLTSVFRLTPHMNSLMSWLKDIMVLWEGVRTADPQSTLFSVQNMQPMINHFSARPLQEKAALLYFLKRTSAYQNGNIRPAAVLQRFLAPANNNPWPNNVKIFNSYASILVDFLDEPHQLHRYFPNCTADQTDWLSKIILTESILREARIGQRSLFDSSCGILLANANSSSEKFEYLFALFGLANDRFQRWERTLFSIAGSRNKTEGIVKRTFEIPYESGPNGCITAFLMPEKVALFRYLSQQKERTFVELSDQGISPDMIARMMYCDMLRPTVRLCDQFLGRNMQPMIQAAPMLMHL